MFSCQLYHVAFDRLESHTQARRHVFKSGPAEVRASAEGMSRGGGGGARERVSNLL